MTDHYTDTGHDYVSVACWHAHHDRCLPPECEYCMALCRCPCHEEHDPDSFGDIISETSVGDDEAMALRARTPRHVTQEIVTNMKLATDIYVCPDHVRTGGYEECCECGGWDDGDPDRGRHCSEANT